MATVKKLLKGLSGTRPGAREPQEDSGYFSTMFLEHDEATPRLVPWATRAADVQARAVEHSTGAIQFARAWNDDRHAVLLREGELKKLTEYLDFVNIDAEREVITQDEQGDYLLIVLDGTIAVDREQPWGGRARLGEAKAGDLLGEMSLLDAGTRFSSCRSITPCMLAVLEAKALDRMMNDDPRLAAVLMAALARRLSLRLRQASARLSALLTNA
ncbi:MAG: cyclic nucleotide-binding domain-containing protein [Burkholderiaceae bacterium]